MEGTIVNFRQGRHTQTTNQMVIEVEGLDSKDKAAKLAGKKVTFTTLSGKKIMGEVRSAHGNSGAIRVLFEKGLPGQSLTRKVSIE
jgi:large subunit ribosomal protein L35Ae